MEGTACAKAQRQERTHLVWGLPAALHCGRAIGRSTGSGAQVRGVRRAGLGSPDSLPGPSASLTSFAPWLLREEGALALAAQKEALTLERGSEEGGASWCVFLDASQESTPHLTPWQPGIWGSCLQAGEPLRG